MFYDDHNPPHFHVRYGENKAVIRINDFALVEGYLPPKALGLIYEWSSIHKEDLLEDWNLAMKNQILKKIAPLE